jgi:hypothetical protein
MHHFRLILTPVPLRTLFTIMYRTQTLHTAFPLTPIGYLEISGTLSYQWGRYHGLAYMYSVATSLAKLYTTFPSTYIIITNIEVDNTTTTAPSPANGLTALIEAIHHNPVLHITPPSSPHGNTPTLGFYTSHTRLGHLDRLPTPQPIPRPARPL